MTIYDQTDPKTGLRHIVYRIGVTNDREKYDLYELTVVNGASEWSTQIKFQHPFMGVGTEGVNEDQLCAVLLDRLASRPLESFQPLPLHPSNIERMKALSKLFAYGQGADRKEGEG